MPSELTIALKKALQESQKIRKDLLSNEEQYESNIKEIEAAGETIRINIEEIQSLKEDVTNESLRFEQKATRFGTEDEDSCLRLVNEVTQINENNESLRDKITEREENNKKLEMRVIELTQENKVLPASRDAIKQRKEKNRTQIKCLVEMAENAEKLQLELPNIEHDYFEKDERLYLLEVSSDFKIFQLLFEHFMQTELLDPKKKADIFSDLLINFISFGNFIDYMLEIYHSNRSTLSLDTKTSAWYWTFEMGDEKEWSHNQALAMAISDQNEYAAIRLLCYGADPDVVEVKQDSEFKKLNDVLASFDEINKTNFSDLIQASIDLNAAIQCLLNKGSKIEAIAKLASAMKLYPIFVSQYIKTQFDLAMLQVNDMVPTDKKDYHFLLDLIDFCAYICYIDEEAKSFKVLIQNDILPQVITYPLIDSENALFKNEEEVTAFIEKPYIKSLYTTSSCISTMNRMAEGVKLISTQSSLTFFNPPKANNGDAFEQSERWEGPSF